MKQVIIRIISSLIIAISLILVLIYTYVDKNITWSSLDQLIYSIHNAEGTSNEVIKAGLFFVIKYFAIVVLAYYLLRFIAKKIFNTKKTNIYIKINNKKISISPLNKIVKSLLILLLAFIYIFLGLGVIDYVKNLFDRSTIFEEEYVDPRSTKITFDEEKRNLIFIYVESLENSALSKSSGGLQQETYLPNLEALLNENINFSNTDNIGGAFVLPGTTWTAGGLVAQTAGIPLKTGKIDGNSYSSDNFLSGAYSLGDVLKDNGYKNYFMLGSDANFGGRRYYFEQHGDYELFDYNWAIKEKLIPEDYEVWWGYEDLKLFDFAKDKLSEISKNEEPFNFSILTADTHFPDGYTDDNCENKFSSHYANSYLCSDSKINDFINWVKGQDFYDNTTIIITGDHLTMQQVFFVPTDNYNRTVFNMIINGHEYEKVNYKNRQFNTMDIYPTTIAALGGSIEGNRLGLGTNLYSDKQTLQEKYGFDYMHDQLLKNSDFYNHNILEGDYIILNK